METTEMGLYRVEGLGFRVFLGLYLENGKS